jgi:hypothetical protein
MKLTVQLFVMGFLLGGALGAGGYVGYERYQAEHQPAETGTVKGAKTPDDGLKAANVPEQGLNLRIRPTDTVGRLTDGANTVIGARIFDPLNGEITDAPHVDVIWQRQAAFQDLPAATSFDEYKNQQSTDFTVDQAKELEIDGRPAVKQSYVTQVEVPGPFGSSQKKPLPGLRWVIDRGDGEFLILRSTLAAQKYLDLVTLNLTFSEKRASPAPSGAVKNAGTDDLQGTISLEGPDASPKQGTSELDVAQPESGGIELKLE